MKTPYRIEFYYVDHVGNEFMCLRMPYQRGDALRGYLRKAIKIVQLSRNLYGHILREHWGFIGKLTIKVKQYYLATSKSL